MNTHEEWFEAAAGLARRAPCHRAKCGAVIVSSRGMLIGVGYNAPPLDDESQRVCDVDFDMDKKAKYDKTCCVHAEWSAILNACTRAGTKVPGSTLYFMRVDENGNYTDAGEPFCTVCSRLAMQSGVKVFGLWNGGPDMIDIKEYNRRSWQYHLKE